MSESDSSYKQEKLFEEFSPASTEEWKAQIEEDLRGEDYEEKLVWKTYEGFHVEPFYRQEDLESLEYLTESLPGEFPYVRGISTTENDWKISEHVYAHDIDSANRLARNGLERGLSALTFICEVRGDKILGIPIQNRKDMEELLKRIAIDQIAVNFRCGTAPLEILSLYINEAKKRGISLDDLKGSVDSDPIKYLGLDGSFYGTQKERLNELRAIISYLDKHMPGFAGVRVHSNHFQNSGSSVVQELAFTLATGTEYLAQLTSMDLSVEQITRHMRFSFTVGSNYFMEIAKLRAARVLWAQIVEQFGPKLDESREIKIDATTSFWNKTVYDPYVNMLRGTVEAMAASIGGCDSITVSPFDETFRSPGRFSRRIARNTQLMLKHESYLSKVIDPSGGSYYIENLTDSIARESWSLFQQVEERGGIIEALKSGFVQNEVKRVRQKRITNLTTRNEVLLGSNQYPNLDESKADEIEDVYEITSLHKSDKVIQVEQPASVESLLDIFSEDGANIGDVMLRGDQEFDLEIKTLKPYRGALEFEEIRLATEQYYQRTGKVPSVFLLPIGHLARRNARASFSANFFGCGGFQMAENIGFDSLEEGVAEALASGAKIVVICSSDKEYSEFGFDICRKLKEENPDLFVVIAGYPKEIVEDLKRAGVDDFIHRESNVVQILKKYQSLLGIDSVTSRRERKLA